jgi:pimeloyl-ACP methyl ester carboxylesterase
MRRKRQVTPLEAAMLRGKWIGATTVGVGVALLTGSCTAAPAPTEQAATTAVPSTSPTSAAIQTSIEGTFPVADDGRALAVLCRGTGSPAVLFDAGTGDAGIARWRGSPITEALAVDRMVCTYDRAGLGGSDAAPARPRALDDVIEDLHQLLDEADIPRPLVMVGSSGGGFNIYHYAGRYPDDVAALVMLDVPAGNADIPVDEVPAWDSPENPEHVDFVAAERQMAVARLPLPPVPVTVVTADGGQSADPAEQKVWLDGSSRPVQMVLHGGHDIQYDDPDGVLAAVVDTLDAVDGS